MTKRLLVAVVLVAASAEARRVVHIPTLGELCPGHAEWEKVEQCIRRQGTMTLERDQRDAKLVRLGPQSRLAGIALYTNAKQWRMRGEVRLSQDHEVLGFQRATYGKRSAYRIDIGMSVATRIPLDDETLVPGVLRHRLTLLCFDDSTGCAQVITACDALVHGKAVHSFRGQLVYENRKLEVRGDRRNVGGSCTAEDLVFEE